MRRSLGRASVLALAILIPSQVLAAGGTPPDGKHGPLPPPERVEGRSSCPGGVEEAFTNLSGPVASRLEDLQTAYESWAGFRAVVYDGEHVFLVVDESTIGSWTKLAAQEGVELARSCVRPEVLADATAATAELAKARNGVSSVAYDALRDTVDMRSSVGREKALAAIEATGGATASERAVSALADGTLEVSTLPIEAARAGRTNDGSPHWGGARTRTTLADGTGLCTTGFYISSATRGTVMVTAGHCSDGLNGKTVKNGDSSLTIGTTEGVSFPNPDLGVIDGGLYAARTYSSNDNTTWDNIINAVNPTTGVTYCQYGATSLRRCYAYTSLSAQFCDPDGCTTSLAYTSGPSGTGGSLGSGGDSGGGVFKEASTGVSARGIVVARGCDATRCYAWDHRLSTILAHYDAEVFIIP